MDKSKNLLSYRLTFIVLLSCLAIPISAQSKKAERLLKKGNTALDKNQYVGASVYFTNALAIEPDNAAAYYLRGYSFLALKRKDAAENDFKKAIEYDQEGIRAYIHLIPLLREDNRCQEAHHYIDMMENISEDNVGAAHFQRALCFEKNKSIEEAISSYQLAALHFTKMGSDYQKILEDCRQKINNLKRL